MRLGATFFRRKELVEPAVDLAKEMDCIEAAIFRVICACVVVFLVYFRLATLNVALEMKSI